jgi:hypothetical protein
MAGVAGHCTGTIPVCVVSFQFGVPTVRVIVLTPRVKVTGVVLTACPLCVRAFRVRVYVPAAVREALVV